MITIWKYELPSMNDFEIELPMDAKFLSIQVQNDKPVAWYLVDTNNEIIKRKYRIIGTGHKIINDTQWKYLDTFQLNNGNYVGHLFEEGK